LTANTIVHGTTHGATHTHHANSHRRQRNIAANHERATIARQTNHACRVVWTARIRAHRADVLLFSKTASAVHNQPVRILTIIASTLLATPSVFAQSAERRPDPRVTLSPPAPPTAPITIVDGVLASVGATVLAVPASIGLANAMTRLSPDLLGGGIPALLWLGLAPPFAAHGLAALAMNLHEPGRYNLWPSIFATLGVHIGAVAVGALSGVWLGNVSHMALFTLAEAVLLPSVAVTLTWATRRRPPPSPPTRAARGHTPTDAAHATLVASRRSSDEPQALESTTPGAVVFPVMVGRF
jgi:hypothetical protein